MTKRATRTIQSTHHLAHRKLKNAIQVIVVMVSLTLATVGLATMFNPLGMLENFSVDPVGIHGLNTVRADIGGLLLGSAIMIAIGLWRSNTTWFLAVAAIMLTVEFGRFVGLAIDGLDVGVATPLVIELFVATVMLLAHWKLKPKNRSAKQRHQKDPAN
jgi:hypothetical protein